MFVCLYTITSVACLPVYIWEYCLSACQYTYIYECCLSACLHSQVLLVCLSTFKSVACLPIYISEQCLSACLYIWVLLVCLSIYGIVACLPVYIWEWCLSAYLYLAKCHPAAPLTIRNCEESIGHAIASRYIAWDPLSNIHGYNNKELWGEYSSIYHMGSVIQYPRLQLILTDVNPSVQSLRIRLGLWWLTFLCLLFMI